MDRNKKTKRLHFRIRFEYRILPRGLRVFKKRRDLKREAASIRRERLAALQKDFIKGIRILDVDPNYSVYFKDDEGQDVAFAPAQIGFSANTPQDLVSFLLSKGFEHIQLLDPCFYSQEEVGFSSFVEGIQKELENHGFYLETPDEHDDGYRYEIKELDILPEPSEEESIAIADAPPPEEAQKEEAPVEEEESTEEDISVGDEQAPDLEPESLPDPIADEPTEETAPVPIIEEGAEQSFPESEPVLSFRAERGILPTEEQPPDLESDPIADEPIEETADPTLGVVRKRWQLQWDLEIIAILSLALAALITLGGDGWVNYPRVAVGLPFVLLAPGYVFIAALFPQKDALNGGERLALSFGLSLTLTPLICLGLYFTPWGARLVPVLTSLIIFILLMGTISFYRRGKLPEDERYYPSFGFGNPIWREQPLFDKVLSIALVISILFAIGSIGYLIGSYGG